LVVEVEPRRLLGGGQDADEQGAIDATGEDRSATPKNDDFDGAVGADLVERGGQLLHQRFVEGVAFVGAIEPESGDGSVAFDGDARHARSLERLVAETSCRGADPCYGAGTFSTRASVRPGS
jgi:hypothetical protein